MDVGIEGDQRIQDVEFFKVVQCKGMVLFQSLAEVILKYYLKYYMMLHAQTG